MAYDDLNKTRYTHRDYNSIKKDLMSAIPSLTQEWTSTEESDPGVVLVKLMSMFGDTLSYNVDKIALELYLPTVTQRKNCAKILRLLGYKMHWYRSAQVNVKVKLTSDLPFTGGSAPHVVLRPFEAVLRGGDTYYTMIPQTTNDWSEVDISSSTEYTSTMFVEGVLRTVTFSNEDLVNNRYYLSEDNVDESHLWLTFGGSRTVCDLVESLYLVTDDQRVSFEFNIDEYGHAYIELINYWRDILGNSATTETFTLRYLLSSGAEGVVSSNQLTTMISADYESGATSDNLDIEHGSNNSELNPNPNDKKGYDPQTVEEARQDASNYVFTHDTLVTVSDYERAVKREGTGVTASKLVDNQVILDDGLNVSEIAARAEDIFTKSGDKLAPYLAIIYMLESSANESTNYYCPKVTGRNYTFDNYSDTSVSSEIRSLGAFPYKPTSLVQSTVDNMVQSSKSLNVDIQYGTTKMYPFTISGTLYLSEPLSPSNTQLVVTHVDSALQDYFYPSLQSYGKKPLLVETVNKIQDSDDNIKYFNAPDSGSVFSYNSICDLSKFDTTSFTHYNGLDRSKFNIAPEFMTFKIKNLGSTEATITGVKDKSQPASPVDYTISSGSTVSVIVGGTYSVDGETLSFSDLDELDSLCSALKNNSSLVYVK